MNAISSDVPIASPSGVVWKKRFPWAILWALLLFGFLWVMDFPDPMADDLFYSGASLNLANGGDLSNPLLARQLFPGHLFLIYPPVHPYVLAWWLKAFGISAAAMTGYQALMYMITATSGILFLRRRGVPGWLEWLVPLAVMGAFMRAGLRAEPTSVALTMAGFAVVAYSTRVRISLAAGFFLMALGAAAAPRITVYSTALMLVATLDYRYAPGKSPRDLASFVTTALAGVLGAFLLFLWLLNFHLGDFWRAFHHYSALVGGSRMFLLSQYLRAGVGSTQWPLFPLALCLLLLTWRGPWTPMKRLGTLLIATLPIMFLMGALGHGTTWFVCLSLFALAAHLLQNPPGRNRTVFIASLLGAVLLMANLKTLVEIAGIAGGRIKLTAGSQQSEALAMRSTPEHTILVDQYAARFVFNYRIPEGFIYYPFAMPFPQSMAVLPQSLLPGDICLLGPYGAQNLKDNHLIDLPVPMWDTGLKNWSFVREPREVYIIHANELRLPQRATHD